MTRKEEINILYNKLQSFSKVARELGVSRQYIRAVVTGYKSFSSSGLSYAKFPHLSSQAICVNCKTNIATEVNHKDHNSKNNNASNLEKVCLPCNRRI